MHDLNEPKKTGRGHVAAHAAAFAASFAVFWSLGLLSPISLAAAENDCDTLLGSLSKTGEVPAIIINPADETVKIFTTKGSCSESIEKWSNREPVPSAGKPVSKRRKTAKPSPAPAPAPEPAPKQAPKPVFTSPAPSARTAPSAPSASVLPSGTATFTPEPPADEAPPKPAPKPAPGPARTPSPVFKPPPATGCDYRLKEVWETQVVKIEGIDHWLSRAFTLDLDNNRQVDNVSFTFISKSGSEKVIHYFGLEEEFSGRNYPALALPDESLIGRLCFGDLTYEKPEFFEDKPLKRIWIEVESPDLAGQMEAKEKGIAYQPKTKAKAKKKPWKREEPVSWTLWIAVGGLVLLGAAGAGFFVVRRRKEGDKAKDEDEDEEGRSDDTDDDGGDGDEDKPKKKKKGLAAFFKRRKKKKKASGDGDGEDDADSGE